jgi:glycine/D-amino acid oxidase-like deaminating enzyme
MDRTSVWQGTAGKSVRYPSLQADLKVDVAIVGAGITGLTTAMLLVQAGKRVAVLEAGQVGLGTSGHCTGNLYAPCDVRLHALEQQWGGDIVRQVVASRAAAVDNVEKIAAALHIDCAFVRCPWHLAAAGPEQNDEIRMEAEAAQRAGLQTSLRNDLPLPLPIASALCIDGQAQFQPLDYLRQLAQRISGENCLVFENTTVTAIEDGPALVHTATGTVRCGQVVVATHSPIGVHLVQSQLRVVREYGIALQVDAAPAPGIFWLLGDKHYSIRGFTRGDQHYLVVIGEAHTLGRADDTEKRHLALEEFARLHFEAGPLAYRWSAQRYRAADKLPYIGRNVDATNTFIATGFSGDGLTYGTLAGMLLADQLQGKPNPWEHLYRVDRLDIAHRAKGFEQESTAWAFAAFLRAFALRRPAAMPGPAGQGGWRTGRGLPQRTWRADDRVRALHAHGLRAQVERSRNQLGLPLPRQPLPARRRGNRGAGDRAIGAPWTASAGPGTTAWGRQQRRG